MLHIGNRQPDLDTFESGQRYNLARRRLIELNPIKALVTKKLRHTSLLSLSVDVEWKQRDLVADAHAAALDAADAKPAEIWRVIDCRDEHLERRRRVRWWRRHVTHDCLEQRNEIDCRLIHVHCRHTLTRGSVDDRRVELRRVGLELDEEIEYLVMNTHRVGSRTVDLVYHDNWRASELESLTQDESRLRHRSVEGVDDEQHSVYHSKSALDLAAEIGVPRRIHNVDLGAFPPHGGVFCEDGYSALALQGIRVHHPVHHDLVFAERSSLPQHLVHQSGLAVVDVRDDCDVSDLLRGLHSTEANRAEYPSVGRSASTRPRRKDRVRESSAKRGTRPCR